MADIEAARAEIVKVVGFLVHRFGHEEDVFKHLTLALDHLRDPSPAPIAEAVADLTPPALPDEAPATAVLTDSPDDRHGTEPAMPSPKEPQKKRAGRRK